MRSTCRCTHIRVRVAVSAHGAHVEITAQRETRARMRCDTFMRISGGERAEWYLINEIRIEAGRHGLYAATASHSKTIVAHGKEVHDPGILQRRLAKLANVIRELANVDAHSLTRELSAALQRVVTHIPLHMLHDTCVEIARRIIAHANAECFADLALEECL